MSIREPVDIRGSKGAGHLPNDASIQRFADRDERLTALSGEDTIRVPHELDSPAAVQRYLEENTRG